MIPTASKSPGLQPAVTAAVSADFSAQTPSGIRRVLDVDAHEDAPVACAHGGTDEEAGVRRVRVCRDLDGLLVQLAVGGGGGFHARQSKKSWNTASVTRAPSNPPYATSSVE